MTPFEKAYAEARRKWTRGEGGPTFSFNGKPYSVATREEAARQKERSQSPERGRSYGGRADTRADSSQIPGAGPYKAPAPVANPPCARCTRRLARRRRCPSRDWPT